MTHESNLAPADHLDRIRARARLLELALLGSGGSGMSIDEGTFNDALIQQAQDNARGLDAMAKQIAEGASS